MAYFDRTPDYVIDEETYELQLTAHMQHERDGTEVRCEHCCSFDDTHDPDSCTRNPGKRSKTSKTVQAVYRVWDNEEQQQQEPVLMEGKAIKHTSTFRYLGHLFVCNGDRADDLQRRTDLARATFKSLRHIWAARRIGIELKRRIYQASVISVLVYGHEAWNLTDGVQRKLNGFNAQCLATLYSAWREITPQQRADNIRTHSVALGSTSANGTIGKRQYDIVAHLRARRLKWLGHILRMPPTEQLRQVVIKLAWPAREKNPGSIFMDAPPHSTIGTLIALAGGHDSDEAEQRRFRWRQCTAELVPKTERTQPSPQHRTDGFAVRPTPLSREEKNAAIKAETDRQLTATPVGTLILYSDGGAEGNGANGHHGASGFGVCVTRKTRRWATDCNPKVLDEYFGPVVCDAADPYWLGARRGTNNTGELNGLATCLLHLKHDGGHDPAVICYDSTYAARTTDGTWEAKSNHEAVRITRELFETEHTRRAGGIKLVHVKGHSGDVGNDWADSRVQDGKGPGPYSRIKLTRKETATEKSRRILAIASATPLHRGMPISADPNPGTISLDEITRLLAAACSKQ